MGDDQEHLAAFGPVLAPLYDALEGEVIWLHAKWLEYRKLYGKSRQRVDLLKKTADFFFGVVQNVLWADLLMHIARLTDPPRQGQYENLTLRRLPNAIADKKVAREVHKLLDVVLGKAEFAREWRNRYLAHRELGLAGDHEPLAPLLSAG